MSIVGTKALLSVALLLVAGTAGADEPCGPPAVCDAPAAGLAVYLDAEGRPTFPGPDTPRVTLSAPFATFTAASAPAVIEPAPGGGKMVRLGGRLATMDRVDVIGGEPGAR